MRHFQQPKEIHSSQIVEIAEISYCTMQKKTMITLPPVIKLISRNFVSVTENFSLFDSRHYVSKLPRFLLFPPFVNCGFPLVVGNDALYFFYFLHQKETSVKNGVL